MTLPMCCGPGSVPDDPETETEGEGIESAHIIALRAQTAFNLLAGKTQGHLSSLWEHIGNPQKS